MMNMGMQIMEQLLMVIIKKKTENKKRGLHVLNRELEAVCLDPFQVRS